MKTINVHIDTLIDKVVIDRKMIETNFSDLKEKVKDRLIAEIMLTKDINNKL